MGKPSPLKKTMLVFLTSFVVCTFTGGVLKALSPCSSLPLFAVSDMGFRRGMNAFLKKDAVQSLVAESEVVGHGL